MKLKANVSKHMGVYLFNVPGPGCLTMAMGCYGKWMAMGYALVVCFAQSNIPTLHKLDTLNNVKLNTIQC